VTPRTLLDGDDLASAVSTLTGWSVEEGKLHKEYVFTDFVQAFAFMTAAALCAERKNHHPEWFNVYRTVRVDLSTHDAGGITTWDIELAGEFDEIAGD
jgi:4a-hydroxytetrahydrobiopterin dehydratase